jgi:hypothetical protein
MLTDENVAIPFTAETVVVPDRVPPAAFVPMLRLTLFVEEVTVLPAASWIET